MNSEQSDHVIVIGAGAAGLTAARELVRAGKRVTILEARHRCGGRIDPLPVARFGYPAEGGAEFVHGEAPVTHALLREAGLSLQPVRGSRWTVESGTFSQGRAADPGSDRFYQALAELQTDLPIADFLKQHFAGPDYVRLRRSIERMAEGYDAADPARASAFALRDEWMNEGPGNQGRVAGGYGALIDFLAAEGRRLGVVIHLNAVVKAIEIAAGPVVVRCANGEAHAGTAAILTVPLPLLEEIELPPALRTKAAAATADIGFGNVIKILLRFRTRWWADRRGELADLSFLITDREIPVWWTQSPVADPVLTGWFGGPKTTAMSGYDEDRLIETGLVSLGHVFGVNLKKLKDDLVAARAIDWANEAFSRGAYSYATPATREAQSLLASADAGPVLFSGEALYRGRDMGTVEAALASGLQAARALLAANATAAP
jgi:monoamine oxidase